jgi:hypothetical protein
MLLMGTRDWTLTLMVSSFSGCALKRSVLSG